MPTQSKFKDVPTDKLTKRFEEAKQARKKYETNWGASKRMYDSKQWDGIPKIAWYQSEPVFNKVFEFVETMRGLLSDNSWGIDSIPASLPDGATDKSINEFSDKVNKLLDFLWVDNRMQSKLAQVLQHVFLYGTGFLKSTFDPQNISASGIGQIITEIVSPYYIFPDPDATDVYDASFIIEHHPVTYRWVIERYPDAAQELLDSGEASTTEYSQAKGDRSEGPVDTSEGKRVDIYEHWYKDSAMIEDEDEQGVKTTKPKYASGIRRTVITAGGIVLEDGEALYNMFPYTRFVEIPRPGEFFGDCTIHKVLGIQSTINSLLRTIIDNGMWLVHGIWVVDSTSGVTPSSLAGYGPRDTIVKNPGTEVYRDGGAALPGHIFETLNQQTEAFDIVTGFPNVLRGIVPSRQPVQTTMMQQESSEVRTRERQRRVEEALEDLGKLWLDIVSEHWSDTRTIRNKKALGGFDMFEIVKTDFDNWRWDVHVVHGSTGPMDRVSMMQTLTDMVTNLGIQIPPMYAVKLSGLPGLEAAMLEQENAMAAQQMPDGSVPPEEEMPDEELETEYPEEGIPLDGTGMPIAGGEMGAAQPVPTPEELLAMMGGGGAGLPPMV